MIDIGAFIDLTGQKFGRLTVLCRASDYVSPNGRRLTQWLCECDCENKNKVIVSAWSLKDGRTKSCGCLAIEQAKKNICKSWETNKKYNPYDLTGDFGIGYTLKGEEFYFDKEDLCKIEKYCWMIDNGYVVSSERINNKQKKIKMHKLLLPEVKLVDHINGNGCDNRKCNLREATRSQNNMNKKLLSNNTSGVTGVYWAKNCNKWRAYITINHKRIDLGVFDIFEEAVTVRKAAEEKYFGEYSYNNSRTT